MRKASSRRASATRTRNRKRQIRRPKVVLDSPLTLSIVEGPVVSVWSPRETIKVRETIRMQVQPDQPAVIGRQEGGQIDYLDPAYRPTRMAPSLDRTILTMREEDVAVSRGHFMLRHSPFGIVLTNGVPRRGGGIRPPMNGTYLLAPVERWMDEGEELLIERGESAKIRLPNGTVILIVADQAR
jgi:hypothetical protein